MPLRRLTMRPSPRRSNFDSTDTSPSSFQSYPVLLSSVLRAHGRRHAGATAASQAPQASGEPDQAVVVGMAPVDDAGLVAVFVVEQEEVVADELHLVQRVVAGHRGRRVLLRAHDAPGLVLVDRRAVERGRLRGQRIGGRDHRGGLRQRPRCFVPVVDLAAVLAPPQPTFKFADGGLKRGVEAVGAGLAPHHRPPAARRDLHMLAVLALWAVALVVELDVEDVDAAVKALKAGQLLRYVYAEMVGDLDVAAFYHNFGARGRFGLLGCVLVWGGQDVAGFHGSA